MSWGAVAGAAITVGGGLIAANQKSKAIKGAANAQKKSTREALAEEQRQYDLSMQEYQRKQAILEQQQQQTQRLMAPYIQAGQGSLFEMLALSGVAVPAQPVTPQGIVPTQTSQYDQASLLPGASVDASGRTTPTQPGQMGILGGRAGAMKPSGTGFTPIESATSPYAGMTGEQAQQVAISKIAESPLLQELMAQGEQAMLQQASATGGLRGGNIQGALAQYRPQMLKNAIDEQYARLAKLSGGGLTATSNLPMINAGARPISGAADYITQLGDIEAERQLSQAETQGQLYGDIAGGLGTAAGAYFNRTK